MKEYILEHDKYPQVTEDLLEILKEIFNDTVNNVKTIEELHHARGQQSVIAFLETVYENQQGE